MIGMMYLVLTALLALNVSKQILDSFIVVNESIEVTNKNFSDKIGNTYSKFEKQYQDNPANVGEYWEKALKARKLSSDLEKFVDSLKYTVLMKTLALPSYDSAKKIILGKAKKLDSYNEPTAYFVGSGDMGTNGQGMVLKKRIDQYKKQMLELVDEKYRGNIKLGLETDGVYYNASKQKQNWIQHNFYQTILAATVTILNKIKAEVYNAEFDVVNQLYSAISADDYKFDAVEARVIPNSRFVFSGEEYQAEVLVAAFETKGKPVVKYQMGTDSLTPAQFAGARVETGEGGRVMLKWPAGGEGPQKYAGFIELLDPSGVMQKYHFKEEYVVSRAIVAVSPTKMNVFYCGVDNPVSITVPGGPQRVIPSMSIGSIKQAPDGKSWIVYGLPKGKPETRINITAIYDGKPKNMGSFPFRLKEVPIPIVKMQGKVSGMIARGVMLALPPLIPTMPEDFNFDITYVVTSFVFGTMVNGEWFPVKVKGNQIDPECVKYLKQGTKGQIVSFSNIKVKGPDGERDIEAPIMLRIN